ncbi:Hypothetical protein SRAE_1000285900 [Strongyloides ratti]|uniref:Uncharacterized protein n=1 Tax=Strongyloides ratti TaxID=34506 RepID=A0A090L475_STRRB|nr:Hypothetical protein SRAE_1000285900 [Strongyloides ratti]CEF64606.1 Hypothetical protein SRAE_1000285900 [Strongyloides ratti]
MYLYNKLIIYYKIEIMFNGIKKSPKELANEKELARNECLKSFYQFLSVGVLLECAAFFGTKFGYDCLMN